MQNFTRGWKVALRKTSAWGLELILAVAVVAWDATIAVGQSAAEALHGEFSIGPGSQAGTQVVLTVPIARNV